MSRLRDQRFVALGQTSVQLVGPNMRRKSVIISAPPALPDEQTNTGAFGSAVDTSTTGAKTNYTLPAGQQGILAGATFAETTGTGVVAALQVVRASVTYTLASYTTSGQYSGAFVLQAGDKVQWNVTTAIGASASDFTLSVALDQLSQRVTISFIGPAVVDQGINLAPGGMPLTLSAENIGDAITDPIYAIANAGSPSIGVIDLFGL